MNSTQTKVSRAALLQTGLLVFGGSVGEIPLSLTKMAHDELSDAQAGTAAILWVIGSALDKKEAKFCGELGSMSVRGPKRMVPIRYQLHRGDSDEKVITIFTPQEEPLNHA